MDRRAFLRTSATAVGAAVLAGCSGGGVETPTGNEVAMVGTTGSYYFDPIGLYVDAGTTVTFSVGSGTHSSTAYAPETGHASVRRIPEGAESWNSGVISGSDTYEHTFETPGTYDYFCIPHKSLGMVGRIVVGEPGGPAEGSDPPDGAVPDSAAIVDQERIPHDEFEG